MYHFRTLGALGLQYYCGLGLSCSARAELSRAALNSFLRSHSGMVCSFVMRNPLDVPGADKFTDAGVIVKARIKTVPLRQWTWAAR